MLILFHVLAALTSIGYTTYLFIAPSEPKLRTSYVLVVLTLISGTFLVISKPSHILQTCMTGLVYIGFVLGVIIAARHRMASQTSNNKPTPKL